MNAKKFALTLKKIVLSLLLSIVFAFVVTTIVSYGYLVKWSNEHKTQVVSYWIPENVKIEVKTDPPDFEKTVLLHDPGSLMMLADSNSVMTICIEPPRIRYFLGVGTNYVSGLDRRTLAGENYGMSMRYKFRTLEAGKVEFTYHLSYLKICFGMIFWAILGLIAGMLFTTIVYYSVKMVLGMLVPEHLQAVIRKRSPWLAEAQDAWKNSEKK